MPPLLTRRPAPIFLPESIQVWIQEGRFMNKYADLKRSISLKDYAENKLKRKDKTFVCPNCGSGEGPNGTPAFFLKGESWRCFSCDRSGDIFDLAGIVEGIGEDDKRGQLEAVAAWAGYPLEGAKPAQIARPKAKPEAKPEPKRDETLERTRQRQEAYVRDAQKALKGNQMAISYLEGRGISEEQAAAWGLGYDPKKGRLVIPWKGCPYYHADRDVTGKAKMKYLYPKSEEVGARPLYNPAALFEQVAFVVEGALDALAVEGCGYQAIALGSNRNRQLADAIGAKGFSGAIVLALDNDKAGWEGAQDTAAALDALNVPHVSLNMGDSKDASEWWQKDREGLRAALTAAYQEAIQEQDRREALRYTSTLDKLRVFDPVDVAVNIWDVDQLQDPIPTGLHGLDEMLGGGLPRGLIVLGAVSSVGKTTFTLQVADTMAAAGQPVLFVTIEQSAQEIVAKSLARTMKQRYEMGGAYTATAQEIVSKKRRESWTEIQQASLLEALNTYSSKVAPNMRIFEGRKQPTVSDVRNVAELMGKHYGAAPVVFIDYLQLVAPSDSRDGAKEATDHNITELRQLARELQTPVFVISSLNRSSYGKGVTLDSFKESGAIEYGADVLLGLQPAGMSDRLDGITDEKKAKKEADRMTRESKAKLTRECELIVLKQRNGRMPEKGLGLTFHAPSGLFEETEPRSGQEVLSL